MIFHIFVRACDKYDFTFSLSSYGKLVVTLKPNGTFSNIDVEQNYYDFNYTKLFLRAIKEMKRYRKERGYQ